MLVMTNGPPLPGKVSVEPTEGSEFTTPFFISALHWSDDDLPLTYIFGIEERTNKRTLLQARTEANSGSHFLIAGHRNEDHGVTLYCNVFDLYDAFSISHANVIVESISTPDAEVEGSSDSVRLAAIGDFVEQQLSSASAFSDLSDAPLLVNLVRATIGTALSAMNQVDCSLQLQAPYDSCSALNRQDCSSTPHSCGECKDGYYGQQGHGNAPCSRSLDDLDHVLKTCPGDCGSSDQGQCVASHDGDPYPTDATTCYVTNAVCSVVCVCLPGYTGSGCQYKEEDLEKRKALKESLLDSSIAIINSVSDLNVKQDTEDAIASIGSLTLQAEELSYSSKTKLSDVIKSVSGSIRSFADKGKPVNKAEVESVLSACDASFLDLGQETATTTTTSSSSGTNTGLIGSVSNIAAASASGLVHAEDTEEYITSSFSVTSAMFSTDAAFTSGWNSSQANTTFLDSRPFTLSSGTQVLGSAPVSVDMSGVFLDTSSDLREPVYLVRVKESLIDPGEPYSTENNPVVAQGYLKPSVISDAVMMSIPSTRDSDSELHTLCSASPERKMRFKLPFNYNISSLTSTPRSQPNVTTHVCRAGKKASMFVACAGVDYSLECDGIFEGTRSISCANQVVPQVQCQASLSRDQQSSAFCQVAHTSPDFVECECDLCSSNMIQPQRRLASGSSSGALDNQDVVTLVAMADFVLDEFVEMNENYEAILDVSTYKNTTLVWGALILFLSLTLVAVTVSEFHIAQKSRRTTLPLSNASDLKAAESYAAQFRDEVRRNSATMLPHSDDAGYGDNMRNKSVRQMSAYIDSIFPMVFSEKPTAVRFLEELIANHLFLKLFMAKDRYSRLFAAYQFVSSVLQGCFIVALVTSLEMGDTSEACDSFSSPVACEKKVSIHDSTSTACLWEQSDMQCIDAERGSLVSIMFVILLTLVISTPLRILNGLLFEGLLDAPLCEEDDDGNVQVAVNDTRAEPRMHISLHHEDTTSSPSRLSCTLAKLKYWFGWARAYRRTIVVPRSVANSRQSFFKPPMSKKQLSRRSQRATLNSNRQSKLPTSSNEVDMDSAIDELTWATIQPIKRFIDTDTQISQMDIALELYLKRRRAMGQPYSFNTRMHPSFIRKSNQNFLQVWRVHTIDDSEDYDQRGHLSYHDVDNLTFWRTEDTINEIEEVVKEIFSQTEQSILDFSTGQVGSTAAGAELFRLLVLDLLGRQTSRGRIFDAKSGAHVVKVKFSVAPVVKVLAWVLTATLNVYYVSMCVIYATEKTREWQESWLLFSTAFAFFLVCIEMTSEAILLGFVIPGQVVNDIRLLQLELHKTLESTELLHELTMHARLVEQILSGTSEGGLDSLEVDSRQIVACEAEETKKNKHTALKVLRALVSGKGDKTIIGNDLESQSTARIRNEDDAFSATDYLFVSQMVSNAFPLIPEAVFAKHFRSVHPRKGLQRYKTPCKDDGSWFSKLMHRMSTLSCASVLVWVGTQSMTFQKIIVNAPLPALSALFSGSLYTASKYSPTEVNAVIGGAIFSFVCVLAWVLHGVYRVVNQNLQDESDTRLNSSLMNRATGAVVVPSVSCGIQLAPAPLRRRSIVNPSLDEEIEIQASLSAKPQGTKVADQDTMLRKQSSEALHTLDTSVTQAKHIEDRFTAADRVRRASLVLEEEVSHNATQLRLKERLTQTGSTDVISSRLGNDGRSDVLVTFHDEDDDEDDANNRGGGDGYFDTGIETAKIEHFSSSVGIDMLSATGMAHTAVISNHQKGMSAKKMEVNKVLQLSTSLAKDKKIGKIGLTSGMKLSVLAAVTKAVGKMKQKKTKKTKFRPSRIPNKSKTVRMARTSTKKKAQTKIVHPNASTKDEESVNGGKKCLPRKTVGKKTRKKLTVVRIKDLPLNDIGDNSTLDSDDSHNEFEDVVDIRDTVPTGKDKVIRRLQSLAVSNDSSTKNKKEKPRRTKTSTKKNTVRLTKK